MGDMEIKTDKGHVCMFTHTRPPRSTQVCWLWKHSRNTAHRPAIHAFTLAQHTWANGQSYEEGRASFSLYLKVTSNRLIEVCNQLHPRSSKFRPFLSNKF